MKQPLLEIKNVNLSIGSTHVLRDLSLSLYPGEVLGLVGESGCGKSMTANAIFQLLPPSSFCLGEINFLGKNLLALNSKEMSVMRGTSLGLILQDPALSLNPLMKIGKQLVDGLCFHKKISSIQAKEIASLWLQRVGLRDVQTHMRQYPHEMSGGMKQRVLIAMALMTQPSLLIADEPTTALDMTTQAIILDLLKRIQQEENLTLLFITHDLGIVANYCDKVAVMYAGSVVETGSVEEVFSRPRHPYTKILLEAS